MTPPRPTRWRLPGFGQGGHSLSRQLLLWVLLPQVVLWIAGGLAAYRLAAGYVAEAIDASLLQASRALSRQLKPIGSGLLIDFPKAAQAVLEADPEDRLYYMVSSPPGQFILGNKALPPPPDPAEPAAPAAALGTPRFYDGEMVLDRGPVPQPVRVAALTLRLGEADSDAPLLLVQVARSRTNREELARRIGLDMLLPMSTLVLLMTLIVWLGIRTGLSPLNRLRQQVEGRAATDLTPLQLDAPPRELWSLASALNDLLEAVQHSVDAQKRFIGDAAHQLRTPLAGLKSQTELALALATEPEMQQRLQRVHESATRSAHLVTQLLTLARSEPEAAPATGTARFDLHAMLQALVSQWVPRALKAGVDLGWAPESDGPVWVNGPPLLLQEAVVNLLDNALQYAGRDSEVTVGLRVHDNWAELEVADTGPGLPPGAQDRVFERFYRATDQGNGCGLGLAIVRQIVHRMGGEVRLQPVQPHGLVVQLRLPLANP